MTGARGDERPGRDFPRAITGRPTFPVGAMSIDEKLEKLEEDFAVLPGSQERNAYLLDLGKKLKPSEPSVRRDEFEIKGCQFKSWLRSWYADGSMKFQGDSESQLGRGMIFVCLELFNDQPPDEILKFDPRTILPKLRLQHHLSSTRSNAFVLVPQYMKQRALEFSAA